MYVDVHTHLTHAKFDGDWRDVAQRAADAELDVVIVNGLEPTSNRRVLELCREFEHLHPAIGIYPVDAGCAAIGAHNWAHDWGPPETFDVDAEIAWIESHLDEVIAIGECGLDRYWVDDDDVRREQERVLRRLCELSLKADKPLILHSRKAEERTFEIVREMGVRRADFHCWGGKSRLAVKIAEEGYYFSIPPVVTRAQSFQALARKLPLERLLTETDAPYMGPEAGERNEPRNVTQGVAAIARARGESVEDVRSAIRENCERLFFRR